MYQIVDWNGRYEHERTRRLKHPLRYLMIPTHEEAVAYRVLTAGSDGAACYGCWCAIRNVAALATPRGHLVRDDGTPHTSATLAVVTHLDPDAMGETIRRCLSPQVHWLEEIVMPGEKPPTLIIVPEPETSHRTVPEEAPTPPPAPAAPSEHTPPDWEADWSPVPDAEPEPEAAPEPIKNPDGRVFQALRERQLFWVEEAEVTRAGRMIYKKCGNQWSAHGLGALWYACTRTPRPNDVVAFAVGCMKGKSGARAEFDSYVEMAGQALKALAAPVAVPHE